MKNHYLLILSVILFFGFSAVAQTNPTAQNLPYTQNFGTTTFTVMPTGTAAWTVSSPPMGTQAAAESSTDNGNATVAVATAPETTGGVYGYATSSNGQLYIQTSSNATNGTNQLAIAVKTTGNTNILVSYTVEMISAMPRTIGVELQYRIGTSGSWTAVSGTSYSHNSSDRSNGNTDSYTNISLPSAVNNNADIQLRWVTWRGSEAGNSSGIAIDNISVTGTSNANLIYRSRKNGNWNDTAVWQVSTDSSTWTSAITIPDYHSKTITILSADTVTITATDTIDQTIVNGGLIYGNNTGSVVVIHDGTGTDLTINGTYQDIGPSSNVWMNSATWMMGSNGTLIRTRATSSDNWRDKYQGGISNIPATSNWIIWKTGSANPVISSTGAMYYPNLTIQNTSGSEWTTTSTSEFTGSSDFPRIKGSLNVGGTGTNPVIFIDSNTNASPVLVEGSVTIQSGSGLRIAGTGVAIQGNLVDNGTLYYGASNRRTLTFNGSANQNISGSGTFNIFNLTENEGATTDTIFLASPITISDSLVITKGAFDCQNKQLTGNSATAGRFTMASGTSLLLGLPSSTSNISFPPNFPSSHVSLNSGSIVIYQANTNQAVSSTLPSYGTLIVSTGGTATTKTLAGGITVNGNLTINSNTTLDCQTFQIAGTTSGLFNMASNSKLLLGVSGSGTNVLFPSGFTSAHISLNSSSTVVYQAANRLQVISALPSYGNIMVSSTSSLTKAPTASPLTIVGNLTVKGSVILGMTSNTINLTGIDTIGTGATESFSTGALNIGGNFINNGTYTAGTGTATFNGTLGQAIGGSVSTTFYNLTISGGSSETVSLGNNQTISNTLSITAGTLDATASNYNLTVDNSFTKSGGTFNPRSATVTMNGGTGENLGGTSTITLYKLNTGISGASIVTLGGNITTASDITIASTATLNGSTHTITTAGNFIDNGTFNANTGLVYFDNNGHQCVSGPTTSSTVTFYNITISGLTYLGTTCFIGITGTITIVPGGRMDCTCP